MATLHPYLGVSKKKGYNNRQNVYAKKYLIRYGLQVNPKTEKDIHKWLEANRPYATAVKKLIRAQIAKEKKEMKNK